MNREKELRRMEEALHREEFRASDPSYRSPERELPRQPSTFSGGSLGEARKWFICSCRVL